MPCDIFSGLSKTTQKIILVTSLSSLLFCTYWFYGRTVGSVYIQEIDSSQSLLKRLTQRNTPEVKVLLTSNGKKYYSESFKLESQNTEYQLKFTKSTIITQIDSLKILDARVNIGNDLLVLGQILQTFELPKQEGIENVLNIA